MTHWIPLTDYVDMLHGYKSAATIKAYANGSISTDGKPRIEAKLTKTDPHKRATWHVDVDGERAKALISKADAWKAEQDKPTIEELYDDAQLEIASLRATIDKLNTTIASKSKTIDEMQETIDKLTTTIDSMKPTRTHHTTKDQAERDAQLLAQWEAWHEANPDGTRTEFAAAIGRPATTVRGGLRRALKAIKQ
uniref:Uncharacterized protein n=1 Tax=Bifidobacterium pseudolongum subsp. globosum TaxID=1690 RepID=A0EJ80_9BIFI|nr:hypothetical protein [Bifidobacterium pseudolongum]AAZ30036.1 hypothetical protein [Bifidobacterium pseudolongum subsp. globosum]